VVSILSNTNKEWVFADLGALGGRRCRERHLPHRLGGAGRVPADRFGLDVHLRRGRRAARQGARNPRARAQAGKVIVFDMDGPARAFRSAGHEPGRVAPISDANTTGRILESGSAGSACASPQISPSSCIRRARPASRRAR
jgi:hypothetical protein